MRIAPQVYVRAADIDGLRAKVAQLENGARVELELDDGARISGIVSARPTMLTFFDPAGNEGTNASVRVEQPALETPDTTPGPFDVWLHRVVRIRRLDPRHGPGERTLH